jgi:hypothetical protein
MPLLATALTIENGAKWCQMVPNLNFLERDPFPDSAPPNRGKVYIHVGASTHLIAREAGLLLV